MKDRTETRISLPGPFRSEDLGQGRWRLNGTPDEVYLRVNQPGAAEVLAETDISRLELSWHVAGVTVLLGGRRGIRRVEAASALVHQPRSGLYEALPLAGFDRKARRFWARIFALMRIPGGRLLLRMIARRRR